MAPANYGGGPGAPRPIEDVRIGRSRQIVIDSGAAGCARASGGRTPYRPSLPQTRKPPRSPFSRVRDVRRESSSVIPCESQPRTSFTVIRMPRMHGLPSRLRGSIVMRGCADVITRLSRSAQRVVLRWPTPISGSKTQRPGRDTYLIRPLNSGLTPAMFFEKDITLFPSYRVCP